MMSTALRRYYEILDGDARARYLQTREHRVDIDLQCPTEELWNAHRSGLARMGPEKESTGNSSLLDLKIELARRISECCTLCERKCGAKRSEGKKGHCGVLEPRISSEFLHMGEEPDLIPSYTIFFSGCTFNCVFCQNWDISTRPDSGVEINPGVLAKKIEAKKMNGGGGRGLFGNARNVNWVGGDPTSNLPFILKVLRECKANLPQVWNSNMYLTEQSMGLLNGVVDVYLTDFKYGNDKCAKRLSNAPDYMRIITRNHLLGRTHAEMIIRHLVLPSHVECCTRPALTWIAENLKGVKVNVMAQYRPEHRAMEFPDISRSLRMSEYRTAIEIAENLNLELCD